MYFKCTLIKLLYFSCQYLVSFILSKKKLFMQILWLASWYPNPYEPVNGDFIQRHALAVSKLVPVDVIHVVQIGKDFRTKEGYIHNKEDNFRELIYSFSFRKWGIGFIDKIRYNIKYRFFYRDLLFKYASQYGIPQLIHVHIPLKAGLVAREMCDHWHIPYIVSEQASYYEMSAKDNFFKRSWFFKHNTAKVFRDAKMITNVSATIGKTIQQLFHLKKVETIHNLVDTQYFNYQASKNEIFTWIHASTLGHQKNPEGMIEAFEQLNQVNSNWQLKIVGPVTDSLKKLVEQKGLINKIIFIGEVPYKEVAVHMQSADAFVLFSRHENFPCVIAEALCCGLPIVSSHVGGIAEAVNIENGILVENENIQALANALIKMMSENKNYDRSSISQKAIELYNMETIAEQFVDVYKNILH